MATVEVLGGLVLADDLAHLDADRRGAGQPAGGDPGGDGGEQLLGGGQQVLALAGPVGGQDRVAAGDQPLAGEVPEVISARSCSSKRDSCSGPSSAISFLIAGARSAVIHP